jgi:uncharacterized membrane protein YphA (DoxX/SURF4 family)
MFLRAGQTHFVLQLVPLTQLMIGASFSVVGVLVVIGLFTPFACASASVTLLFIWFTKMPFFNSAGTGDTAAVLDVVAISCALILLGPGALSVDARLFGRREIIIPKSRIGKWD